MTKYKRRREPSAFRPLSIRASSFRAHRPAYQPCPGLATGGRVLRKSACWRWASFSWSAWRACCSGLGPELQPSSIRNNTGTKDKSVITFFIGTFNHSQSNERGKPGNVSPTTESGNGRIGQRHAPCHRFAVSPIHGFALHFSSPGCLLDVSFRQSRSSVLRRSIISFSASSFLRLI